MLRSMRRGFVEYALACSLTNKLKHVNSHGAFAACRLWGSRFRLPRPLAGVFFHSFSERGYVSLRAATILRLTLGRGEPVRFSAPRCFRIGKYAPVAQLDRALASGARGRKFESCRAYHFFASGITSPHNPRTTVASGISELLTKLRTEAACPHQIVCTLDARMRPSRLMTGTPR
jgi:hypothetical protein